MLPRAADIVAADGAGRDRGTEAGGGRLGDRRTRLDHLILELVDSNLRQWDLEDTTRDPGASDTRVANAKREIDRLNLARHRLVEEIDAAIDSALDQPATAPIATESPGMVLDRLSVLVIRRARTAAASSRDPRFADRTVGARVTGCGLVPRPGLLHG